MSKEIEKRIAFVGFSTPIFYDYGTSASRAPSDTSDSPNPILDSPYGLLLLYDEVWFLCRSLCPENMRSLPYVRFLDEEKVFTTLSNLVRPPRENYFSEADIRRLTAKSASYKEIVKRTGVHWEAVPDHHTHGLHVAGVHVQASSRNVENVLFDLEVLSWLGDRRVELITNGFTQQLFEPNGSMLAKMRLSELLTISNIPNYLTKFGPYHPCVDEARENRFLSEFRQWISAQRLRPSETDLCNAKASVEEAISDLGSGLVRLQFAQQIRTQTRSSPGENLLLG